jgi:hypothetical protein
MLNLLTCAEPCSACALSGLRCCSLAVVVAALPRAGHRLTKLIMSLVGIVQSGFESHRSHASATTWRSQQQPPLPFERRGYWSAAIAGTDLARCELAVRAQLEEALRELNRRPTAHMCMQITGGTGFLGSHLIHQLVRHTHIVCRIALHPGVSLLTLSLLVTFGVSRAVHQR